MKRGKGRAHGAAMMVWLFFANLFDPAKVAKTEQINADRSRGGEDQRRSAIPIGRPPHD